MDRIRNDPKLLGDNSNFLGHTMSETVCALEGMGASGLYRETRTESINYVDSENSTVDSAEQPLPPLSSLPEPPSQVQNKEEAKEEESEITYVKETVDRIRRL